MKNAFSVIVIGGSRPILHSKHGALDQLVINPVTLDLTDSSCTKLHNTMSLELVTCNRAIITNFTSLAPFDVVYAIHLLALKFTNILGWSFLKDTFIPSAIWIERASELAGIFTIEFILNLSINHETFVEIALVFS